MKVLTLHEPWATLVARGIKNIETRSWATKVRGRIAIHSGKREVAFPSNVGDVMRSHDIKCGDLRYGVILATADLYECLEMDERVIDNVYRLWGADEIDLGGYDYGRYAWYLRDIKVLDSPIPVRGYQRLWNIDDSVIPAECR